MLNNYEDCRINGELLTDETHTILHKNSVKVSSLNGDQLVEFINDNIPIDRIKINRELSPSATYESFSNLKVGDGGIASINEPAFHLREPNKPKPMQATSSIFSVFHQKTSSYSTPLKNRCIYQTRFRARKIFHIFIQRY